MRANGPNLILRKIEVHPSSICSLRCVYCFGRKIFSGIKSKKNREIPEETLLALGKDISQTPIGHVVVSAMFGEPTKNIATPAFIRTVKEGKREHQYIGFYTNGVSLSDEMVDLLTSENREGDYVHINLSAVSPDAFVRIHKGDGRSHHKAVMAAEKLAREKAKKASCLTIRIVCLIIPDNYKNISDLERFVMRMRREGVDQIRFAFPVPPIGEENMRDLFLNRDQIGEIEQARGYLEGLFPGFVIIPRERLERAPTTNSFRKCFVKDSSLVVRTDSMISPCCYTAYPGYPKIVGPYDARKGIESYIDAMRKVSFNPRIICPPCSWDDYAFNLKQEKQSARRE